MRWASEQVTPLRRGFASILGAGAVLGICVWPISSRLAERPSAELLRYMAAIGATLLVAYAVESSAAVRVSHARDRAQEAWVGALVGAATTGLLGIVVALSLAERAAAEHWIWVDNLAFAFAAGAILLLAVIVVLLPLLAYEWARLSKLDGDE